jgi:hypothetical protein
MKKFIIPFSLIFALMISGLNLVSAQEISPSPEAFDELMATPSEILIKPITPFIKNIEAKELKQKLTITEIEGFNLCRESNECPFENNNFYSEVLIQAGVITDIGDKTIGVSVFGYNYKINIENTNLLRQYWVTSELDEFLVGDVVNIFGYLDQDNYYLIHAKTIRNISLQKRISVLKGLVGSIDNTMKTFVLQTSDNGDQIVVVNSETKIIKSEPVFCIQMIGVYCPSFISTLVSFESLTVGEGMVVRGVWDENAKKIIAESIMIGSDGRPLFNNLERLQNQIKERMENIISTPSPSRGIWQKIIDIFKK